MRGLLIADENLDSRNQLASLFIHDEYAVTVTNSLVNAIEGILNRTIQVALLSGIHDEQDLTRSVTLLRKCNQELTIILVTDEMPLSLLRRVRKEGIFYHALKPVKPEDREEIRQAVSCAFANQGHADGMHPITNSKEAGMKGPRILLSTLLIVAVTTPALAVDTAKTYTSGLLVLGFVGLCALIVVAQMLPAIRSLLAMMKKSAEDAEQRETVTTFHTTKHDS